MCVVTYKPSAKIDNKEDGSIDITSSQGLFFLLVVKETVLLYFPYEFIKVSRLYIITSTDLQRSRPCSSFRWSIHCQNLQEFWKPNNKKILNNVENSDYSECYLIKCCTQVYIQHWHRTNSKNSTFLTYQFFKKGLKFTLIQSTSNYSGKKNLKKLKASNFRIILFPIYAILLMNIINCPKKKRDISSDIYGNDVPITEHNSPDSY